MSDPSLFPITTSQDKSKRSLCICTSPLQAYLFVSLIKSFKLDASVLYLASGHSERISYYVKTLKQVASSVHLIYVADKPIWSVLLRLELIIARCKRIDSIYIASFNSFLPSYVVNRLRVPNLYLFDDGVFTILDANARSHYYQPLPTSVVARALLKVLRVNKINNKLLLEVRLFYTMFPIHQQLVAPSRVVPVQLSMFESAASTVCPLHQTLNIFIGDVPNELSKELAILHEKIVNNDCLHYHIPHPRDYKRAASSKSISIHTIAEEFILQMLTAGHHVNIFSLCSSTLFIVPKHPNLKKYIIHHAQYLMPCLLNKAEAYDISVVDEHDLFRLLRND